MSVMKTPPCVTMGGHVSTDRAVSAAVVRRGALAVTVRYAPAFSGIDKNGIL